MEFGNCLLSHLVQEGSGTSVGYIQVHYSLAHNFSSLLYLFEFLKKLSLPKECVSH